MRGGINIVNWMEIRYTKSEDSKESKGYFWLSVILEKSWKE